MALQKRRHRVWPAILTLPCASSWRRNTEVKNFPCISRATSQAKGKTRNCSVGVHIGPFE